MQSCKSTELQGALHTLAHMDAQLSPNYRSKRPIRLPRCPAEMNRNGEGLRYPYCTSIFSGADYGADLNIRAATRHRLPGGNGQGHQRDLSDPRERHSKGLTLYDEADEPVCCISPATRWRRSPLETGDEPAPHLQYYCTLTEQGLHASPHSLLRQHLDPSMAPTSPAAGVIRAGCRCKIPAAHALARPAYLPGNWDWDWDVAGVSSRVLQGREPNINGDVLRRGGEDRHHDGCCSLRTGRFGSSRLFQSNVERWIV
ncbi:hypothetical protein B0J15DRAFT_467371 [Fusarium solani]|uniref:Uncharacterized protein n=1 Tax=Fusarium solani TaxID=169388 RepID=A0A9P9H3I0_FUSSL|nr:uncharacterized protein B0J15DRAFT_467371 [Fusarium solani]KAH7250495.1 hypothetical protein B0J15DRAFT_467371 [Fusarium solani]